MQTSPSLYDYSFEELAGELGEARAHEVFNSLYRRRDRRARAVTGAAAALGASVEPLRQLSATKGSMSTKYLFELADGNAVEAVRITRRTGHTACVSSQVGCGFGCQFCASGRNGLVRHLTAGEICLQVLELGNVNRMVFMGIGEPLHNYDNVLKAIRILRDRRGRALSTAAMTISTIGVPKALKRLREEHLRINLTISLHATTQEVREELIPGSRAHHIDDVIELSQSWAHRHNRIVTYVYLLLPGINDSPADASRLVDWLAGQPARVNLMRWNPVHGADFQRASDATVHRFRACLDRAGVPVTLRDTQGRDIDAACGQLWLRRATPKVPVALRRPE